jgi:predicted deacylase
MKLKLFEAHGVKLFYYIKGKNPKLLIHSATHGDEARIVYPLGVFLHKYEHVLPDFIWVPEVSPSAVMMGTRNNGRNSDINRLWHVGTNEPEVLANLDLIGDRKFEIFLSFHEDINPDGSGHFYVYDSKDREGSQELELLRSSVRGLSVPLLHGCDDPILNNWVDQAYFWDSKFNGEAHLYLAHQNKVYLGLNIEIPGNLLSHIKYTLIKVIFEQCLKWR